MANDFSKAWPRLRRIISNAFLCKGFTRLDDESFARSVGKQCVSVLQISPSSRVVNGDHIGITATIGLSYPEAEPVYQFLWEINAKASADIYCPLSCRLFELDERISKRNYPLSFSMADDPALRLLVGVVEKIITSDVVPLASLHGAVELLLGDPTSPWFSRGARENFLPAALIVLGRGSEAVHLAQEVRSIYDSVDKDQPRSQAYSRIANRVGEMVAREGLATSNAGIGLGALYKRLH